MVKAKSESRESPTVCLMKVESKDITFCYLEKLHSPLKMGPWNERWINDWKGCMAHESSYRRVPFHSGLIPSYTTFLHTVPTTPAAAYQISLHLIKGIGCRTTSTISNSSWDPSFYTFFFFINLNINKNSYLFLHIIIFLKKLLFF